LGRISASVDVDAPLELCWELNADATRLTEWNPSVVEVREVTGRLDQLGTTYTGVLRAMGRNWNGRNEVVRVEPLQLIETLGKGVGGATARVRVKFERQGSGTRITVTMRYELPGGVLGRIAGGLFAGPELEGQLEASNAGFKRLAEREAHDPSDASVTEG
jgi:uncharacterized membrane protein